MTAVFLSDDWFTKVEAIMDELGHPEVADAAKDVLINLNIHESPDGTVELRMEAGRLERGNAPDAPTTLNVPYDVAYAMFIKNDQAVAMSAFMSGQIKVEGDMTKLMALGAGGGASGGGQAGGDHQARIIAITAPLG